MQTRILSHNQYLCVPHSSAANASSAMAVPLVAQSGTMGMLYVENDTGDPGYDENSLHAMAGLACCLALPVANVIRRNIAKRQNVADAETVIARATQDALTPKALPQWPELQIAAYRHMGTTRCTDYWDIVQLPDKTAAIVLARLHMTGMAVPRFLTEVRSAFRMAALHLEAPHLLCRALNWLIYENEGRNQIDLTCIWLSPQSGKLQYCRAGNGVHIGRFNAQAECEWWDDTTADTLGKNKATPYELQQQTLSPGECLFLLSSGIAHAVNKENKAMGVEGFEENVCDGIGVSLSQNLGEFAKELTEYTSEGACPEDVTVVMIKR
jgi:serine phosphatase RsbU (regulator of sigma subunit)